MKLINFKIVPLTLASFALLALNGCDGTAGVLSDTGLTNVTPTNVTPTNVTPIITEDPTIALVRPLDGNISLTVNEDVTAGLYVNGALIDTTSDLVKDISGDFTVNVQASLIDAFEGEIIVKNAAGDETVSTTTVGLGTTGNDNITGDDNPNLIFGFGGNDIITASAGADSIAGGTGADRMDVGLDNAIDTVVLSKLSDSVVSTSSNLTIGNISIGNTINYANGIDVIDNFDAANGDLIDVFTVSGPFAVLNTLYGTSWAFLRGANYYLSGEFNESTGVFTVMANGAGPDTLLIQGEGSGDTFYSNDSSVILLGVNSNDLTAANFK